MKNVMKIIIFSFFQRIGLYGVQFGAVCFSQKPVVNHFHLNKYSSASELATAIDNFPVRRGSETRMGDGLYVSIYVMSSCNHFTNVLKITVQVQLNLSKPNHIGLKDWFDYSGVLPRFKIQ